MHMNMNMKNNMKIPNGPIISASLLNADLTNLGCELTRAAEAGADMIHLDVMDGRFVDNFTFGNVMAQAIDNVCDLPMDVHLMTMNPARFIRPFADAGADYITIHAETDEKTGEIGGKYAQSVEHNLRTIHALGKKAGVSVNPETPVSVVFPYLALCDLVLIMSVHPGKGGQAFLDSILPKICAVKNEIVRRQLDIRISVDGGVNEETGMKAAIAGADMLVVGSCLFKSDNMREQVAKLHNIPII
jgi:ribulose-phosphate 3-epimerase